MAENFNILISCAGRRVALVRHFKEALAALGLKGGVFAADLDFSGPACHIADKRFTAPRFADGTFIDDMLTLCQRERISLVVPTIDPELPLYAQARAPFAAIGTTLAVSSLQAVDIGADKRKTHLWLASLGLPAPKQAVLSDVLDSPVDWPMPAIVKPARGSSSIGLRRISNAKALAGIEQPETMVIESIAPGDEYTIDVYIDRAGTPRCAVPRKRLETRGGEVSKGVTTRNPALQDLALRVADALPDAFGALNVQVFLDQATGQMNIIEINPRFGGGYPLTEHAGAPFTRWLIEDVLQRDLTAEPDGWRDGLAMLRYDEAVFVDRDEIGRA